MEKDLCGFCHAYVAIRFSGQLHVVAKWHCVDGWIDIVSGDDIYGLLDLLPDGYGLDNFSGSNIACELFDNAFDRIFTRVSQIGIENCRVSITYCDLDVMNDLYVNVRDSRNLVC